MLIHRTYRWRFNQ